MRVDEEEEEDYEIKKIAARVMNRQPPDPKKKREGFGSKIAQDIFDELELEVDFLMAERGWVRDKEHDSCEVCVKKLAEDLGIEPGDTVYSTMDKIKETDLWEAAEKRVKAEKKRLKALAPDPIEVPPRAPPPGDASDDEPPSPPTPPGKKVSLKEAQALYATFKKTEMAKLRKEHPKKSPSDLRDYVFRNWQLSDENPKNCKGKWACLEHAVAPPPEATSPVPCPPAPPPTPVPPSSPPPGESPNAAAVADGDEEEPQVEWQ